jgi:hypothetical protein
LFTILQVNRRQLLSGNSLVECTMYNLQCTVDEDFVLFSKAKGIITEIKG